MTKHDYADVLKQYALDLPSNVPTVASTGGEATDLSPDPVYAALAAIDALMACHDIGAGELLESVADVIHIWEG